MVVHHPYGLHECVADRGSHEFEAAPLEVSAHGLRFQSACGDLLQRLPFVDAGFAPHKLPDVAVEGAKLILHTKECFGVLHCRGDFESVANDSWIGEEGFDFLRAILRDAMRIEAVEGTAIMCTFIEDRAPAQARLGAFENEKFEE